MELPVVDRELEIRPPPIIEKAAAEQSPIRGIELPKDVTPDRLRVPKALKYPERYRSPTDMVVSPITRGLIARTRRNGGALLPPSLLMMDQPKVTSYEGV